jgi:hypothetical protein
MLFVSCCTRFRATGFIAVFAGTNRGALLNAGARDFRRWRAQSEDARCDSGLEASRMCGSSPSRKARRTHRVMRGDWNLAVVALECEQLDQEGLSADRLREAEDEKIADQQVRDFFQKTNPSLSHLIELCSVKDSQKRFIPNPHIGAVLTTNVDSLIQMCDRAGHGSPRILRTIERASTKSKVGKISLYHLHGYITPYEDVDPSVLAPDRLILTEFEYTQRVAVHSLGLSFANDAIILRAWHGRPRFQNRCGIRLRLKSKRRFLRSWNSTNSVSPSLKHA